MIDFVGRLKGEIERVGGVAFESVSSLPFFNVGSTD